MAKLKYLGHSAFYIEGKEFKSLIDPFLSGNPLSCCSPEDFEDLNYIFVTHGHSDHIGNTIDIASRTGATVIANFEICDYLQKKGLLCHAMHIGGTFCFPFGKVKMTNALHGSGILPSDGGNLIYGGNPGGFLIHVDDKKIYHAGDTGLTVDMSLLREEKIDVALLPIGGNFTMDVSDAAKAVEMIRPAMVIPMHYNTFDPIKADPERFKELAAPFADVKIMDPGDEMIL